MILELLYILTAVSIAFIFTALILIALSKTATVPLMLAGLLLLTTGLVVASEGLEIPFGQYEYCDEDSQYWNCTVWQNYTCYGTPEQDSCLAYTEEQCEAIGTDGYNCTWIGTAQQYCYGTPNITCYQLDLWGHANGYEHDKCYETIGCSGEYNVINGTCDKILTNCTTTPLYNNLTASYLGPYSEIDALYYLYILGGLFFFMWGTIAIFERKESATKPTEE